MPSPGAYYSPGQTLTVPNVYLHVENIGGSPLPGSVQGVVAAIVRSDYGVAGQVIPIFSEQQVTNVAGVPSATSNVDMLTIALREGAQQLLWVPFGANGTGTAASVTLMDTATPTPAAAVIVTDKSVGTAGNLDGITVQNHPTRTDLFQIVLWKSGARVQTVNAVSGTTGVGEPQAAVNALAAVPWITAALAPAYVSTGKALARVGTATPVAFAGGVNQTVNSQALSDCLTLLERQAFNVLVVDTEAPADFATILAWVQRQESLGRRHVAVVGEPPSVALATRETDAKALNSWNMIYAGNDTQVLGNVVWNGRRAAAALAGRVAGAGTDRDTTFEPVQDATDVPNPISDDDLPAVLAAGMVVFDKGPSGRVEIVQGNTTYDGISDPSHDAGWTSIYRTMLRFEIIDRLTAAWRINILGKVRNNQAGQQQAIGTGNRVLDPYLKSGKLTSYSIALDPANPPAGRICPLIVRFDDADFIEIIAFRLELEYSPALAAA